MDTLEYWIEHLHTQVSILVNKRYAVHDADDFVFACISFGEISTEDAIDVVVRKHVIVKTFTRVT